MPVVRNGHFAGVHRESGRAGDKKRFALQKVSSGHHSDFFHSYTTPYVT